MTSQQISKIIEYKAFKDEYKAFKDSPLTAELKETHISWVILTEKFAYKIKKPLQYSFLDFSTLEKRKYYCEQEVILNQRLDKDTYIGVVPIRRFQNLPFINAPKGDIIGYAVKMKRLDNEREMDVLLKAGKVNKSHLFQLAGQLATFHSFTDKAENPPNIITMQEDFADLANVATFIREEIGIQEADKIEEAISFSREFLVAHSKEIKERHIMGLTVDGHGDLHTGNIFLINPPVIFDCIEFNAHYRQMDILSELAFLCMDLDFYGQEKLAIYFMEQYNINYPVITKESDHHLFLYYKLYRANIRLKVNALRAMQALDTEIREKHLDLLKDYYHLFKNYLSLLQEKQKESASKNDQPTAKI